MHPNILAELRRKKATGGSGGVPTTWNPDDKEDEIILLNGNLTVTKINVVYQSVRAVASFSSGRHSFEVYYQDVYIDRVKVGIALKSAPLASWALAGYFGACSFSFGSVTYMFYNGENLATAGPSGTGFYVGCLIDMDAGTLEIFANGASLYTFTGLSGEYCPVLTTIGGNSIHIANFGQSPFAYPLLPVDGVFE